MNFLLGFKLLLLIVLVILTIFVELMVNAENIQSLDRKVNCEGKLQYKCVQESPSDFVVDGMTYKCPENLVCNLEQISTCNPCVLKTTNCNGKFSCPAKTPDSVVIGGIQIDCPTGFTCNKNFDSPCNPCVAKICGKPEVEYTCGSRPQQIEIGNIEGRCKNGFVCNKENKYPCTPCIEVESDGDRIVTQMRRKYF